MYTSFYNLTETPFSISSDPRFLWCGKKYWEVLANLRAGVTKTDGYVVLTGDVGTGKTTLVNALLQSLDATVLVAGICHPTLGSLDFFNLVAHAYGAAAEITGKTEFFSFIKALLQRSRQEGKTVLLVIDEAHFLPDERLEEIREMSTIEEAANGRLTILFVGQREFRKILLRPRHLALYQKIALFLETEPLSQHETLNYVAHRLKVAGAREPVFSSAAVRRIHSFSQGYPGLINILCSRAMLKGYVNNQQKIDTAIVAECIEEMQFLNLPPPSPPACLLPESDACPPVLPPAGNGPGAEVVQDNSPALPQAKLQRTFSNRSGFPVPGLTLLLLCAIAAAIGRQVFAVYSSWQSAQLQLEQAREQKISTQDLSLPRIGQQPAGGKIKREIVKPQASGNQPIADDGSPAPPSRQGPGSNTVWPATVNTGSKEAAHASGQISPMKEVLDGQPATPMELAAAAAERGDFQAAVEIMEAGVGIEGDAAEQLRTLYSTALVGQAEQLAADAPEQALALLHRALELDPDNSRTHFILGKIHTELQDYTSAITAYRQAQALAPDYSDALYNLGFVYATVGDYEQAEQLFARVVDLEPDYLDKALFNLAAVQEKLGRIEQCLENLRKAAALSPEDQKIRKYLQKLTATVVQEGPL